MARDISPRTAAPPTPRSAVQQVALAALLAGSTTTAAAKAAGIDRGTLIRWTQNDPEFIATYNSVVSYDA